MAKQGADSAHISRHLLIRDPVLAALFGHGGGNRGFFPLTLVRRRIADEVERLLALLDALDGDPDFEPDDDGEADGGEELFWQENLRGGGR